MKSEKIFLTLLFVIISYTYCRGQSEVIVGFKLNNGKLINHWDLEKYSIKKLNEIVSDSIKEWSSLYVFFALKNNELFVESFSCLINDSAKNKLINSRLKPFSNTKLSDFNGEIRFGLGEIVRKRVSEQGLGFLYEYERVLIFTNGNIVIDTTYKNSDHNDLLFNRRNLDNTSIILRDILIEKIEWAMIKRLLGRKKHRFLVDIVFSNEGIITSFELYGEKVNEQFLSILKENWIGTKWTILSRKGVPFSEKVNFSLVINSKLKEITICSLNH
jgi:hypothetical protein